MAVNKRAFTGGLRTQSGFNATAPFARLTIADDGLTVRLFGFVYARCDWSGVAHVQRVVGGLMGSPGARITLSKCQGRSEIPQFQPVSNSPAQDRFRLSAGLKFPT